MHDHRKRYSERLRRRASDHRLFGRAGPDEAQAILRAARTRCADRHRAARIEVLTYDLATRCCGTRASGFPKVCPRRAGHRRARCGTGSARRSSVSTAPEHTRLRRLIATAFSRRAIEHAHHGHRRRQRSDRPPGRAWPLRRRDRHRAAVSDPGHLRAARRPGRGLGAVVGLGQATSCTPSTGTSPNTRPRS